MTKKKKHPRASKTKKGQHVLFGESMALMMALNSVIGVIVNPLNKAAFDFFRNLNPLIIEPIQEIFPFIFIPLLVFAGYFVLKKEKKTAIAMGIITSIFIGIYAFTNTFFLSMTAPQAAISMGVSGHINVPYMTMGLITVLLLGAIYFWKKD